MIAAEKADELHAASLDIKSILLRNCPEGVTAECFIGVESQPPWIPDRSIRE